MATAETAEGVDYSTSRPSPAGLVAAGKTFVMRYIGPGSPAKHLTHPERDALWAAGLGIVLLAEGSARDALGGYNKGLQHGALVRAALDQLEAPWELPVYFAIDWDVTASQWRDVARYLAGCAFELGAPQIGLYGGYNAVTWAARDHVADWFFQTYAWSHGRWFTGNHVQQYRNGVTVAGGDVDLCRAIRADYGQWTITTGETNMLTTDQANKIDDIANIARGLASGLSQVPMHDKDGVISLDPFYARIAASIPAGSGTGLTEEQIRAIVANETIKALTRLNLSITPV